MALVTLSDCGDWLIGLADMPALPAGAIAGVRSALLPGANLAAPSCGGRRGHLVGFASHYLEELLALEGDKGTRFCWSEIYQMSCI